MRHTTSNNGSVGSSHQFVHIDPVVSFMSGLWNTSPSSLSIKLTTPPTISEVNAAGWKNFQLLAGLVLEDSPGVASLPVSLPCALQCSVLGMLRLLEGPFERLETDLLPARTNQHHSRCPSASLGSTFKCLPTVHGRSSRFAIWETISSHAPPWGQPSPPQTQRLSNHPSWRKLCDCPSETPSDFQSTTHHLLRRFRNLPFHNSFPPKKVVTNPVTLVKSSSLLCGIGPTL